MQLHIYYDSTLTGHWSSCRYKKTPPKRGFLYRKNLSVYQAFRGSAGHRYCRSWLRLPADQQRHKKTHTANTGWVSLTINCLSLVLTQFLADLLDPVLSQLAAASSCNFQT